MRTGVTQPGTEEVEEVQRVVRDYSLMSYISKPPYLITHGFNKNKKSQEKFFSHMCNFWAREECRNGTRYVSYYLDVDISNGQYCLVNPTPLDCITCYIMDDDIGDRDFKSLHHRRLNIIDGSISS